MGVFSPGFSSRAHERNPALPPGQYLERDFPVLTAGPTQRIDKRNWSFSVETETGETRSWNWDEMLALGPEKVATDIHCVTSWTKLGTSWRGVPLQRFLDGLETSAEYLMATSYGGYTTNMPFGEIRDRAWLAFEFDGKELSAEHGGPARLLVPHLYFWKSAKWVTRLTLMTEDQPGFWERNGYNMHGDPWREERYW